MMSDDLVLQRMVVKITPPGAKPHTEQFVETDYNTCLNSLKQYLNNFEPGVRAELMLYEEITDPAVQRSFIQRQLQKRRPK